ncbi:MAG: NAD(P)/FAD-dependent oxidoreductase [Xanthomonadales bacterium]|nr:NAD(P)/FAD-dependent oxidoreductase [Xanthomonadales bacterium]
MDRFDTLVIGAGHNGLVCAALLARAGQRVAVLEAGPAPGGLAAPRAFHDEFRAPVAHSAGHVSTAVAAALELEAHGLAWAQPLPLVGLGPDGHARVIQGESLSGATVSDAAAWPDFHRRLKTFAEALAPHWLQTIPRIAKAPLAELAVFGRMGWSIRRMGREDMREFLRQFALPTRDLVDEHFEDEVLKALVSWDGLIGSRMAPRSPNNAVLMMLYRMAGRAVRSPANLIGALEASARAAGAELRTDARVARLLLEPVEHGFEARGVVLASGERIEAQRVVSSADPQTTLLDLVGARHLEIGFTNRIRRLRCDGLVAKLHLALDGLPDFAGLDRPAGRIVLAPGLDAIEFAFDGSKYGELPETPVLEVAVPSLDDPTLAPDGGHVLSAHVMYVPRHLRDGWNDVARQTLLERTLDVLEGHVPTLRRQIVGHELLTPADIEARHGVTGGHWHHTEFALDQMLMMRPTYEAAQYRTPIHGLWLCGAGTHPAGDLTGAAGHNAAREILR